MSSGLADLNNIVSGMINNGVDLIIGYFDQQLPQRELYNNRVLVCYLSSKPFTLLSDPLVLKGLSLTDLRGRPKQILFADMVRERAYIEMQQTMRRRLPPSLQ
jgi:hypothetical protein